MVVVTRTHADFSFAIATGRSNDRSPHFQAAFDFTSPAYTLLGVHMRPFAVPDSPRYRKRPATLLDVTPEGRGAPTRRLGGGRIASSLIRKGDIRTRRTQPSWRQTSPHPVTSRALSGLLRSRTPRLQRLPWRRPLSPCAPSAPWRSRWSQVFVHRYDATTCPEQALMPEIYSSDSWQAMWLRKFTLGGYPVGRQ